MQTIEIQDWYSLSANIAMGMGEAFGEENEA